LPLRKANEKFAQRRFAGAILVSDNESWVGVGRRGSTPVMTEWQQFVANQRKLGVKSPKLVCIDLQPNTQAQAPERSDILNMGSFNDAVFNVVAAFLSDDSNRFVAEIEAIEL
jgi:60 kDa SS-A/Ro ribonucleoprotein